MASNLRLFRYAVLACIAAAAVAASAADQGDEARWRAVTACAARPDASSRHACLDEVLRGAGLLTPEREAQQQRERFGLETPAAAAAVAPLAAAPADQRLDVQVVGVVVAHDGKLSITTADGATWRQIEATEVSPRPRAGDPMTIRKASLGSYLCQVRNTRAFRCNRSR